MRIHRYFMMLTWLGAATVAQANVQLCDPINDAFPSRVIDEDNPLVVERVLDRWCETTGLPIDFVSAIAEDSPGWTWGQYDPDSDTVTGTPPADYFTTSSIDIAIRVTNGSQQAIARFSLDVEAVNDAPVLTLVPATVTLDEDTTEDVTYMAYDVDSDNIVWDFSASPDSVTFVVDNNLTPGDTLFSTAVVSFDSNDDVWGEYSIELTATDSQNAEASGSTDLVIVEINDPLYYCEPFALYEESEDIGFEIGDVTEHFCDVANENDTHTLVSAVANFSGEILADILLQEDTNSIYVAPHADKNGPFSIDIVVSDGTDEATATIPCNIIPVNDAPRLITPFDNYSTAEDNDYLVSNVYSHFYEPDGQDLWATFSLVPEQDYTFNHATGQLTVMPEENFNGTIDIHVEVRDQEFPDEYVLTASDDFYINWTPVNDTPFYAGGIAETVAAVEDDVFTVHDVLSSFDDVDFAWEGDNLSLHYSGHVIDITRTSEFGFSYDEEEDILTVTTPENVNDDCHNTWITIWVVDQYEAQSETVEVFPSIAPVNDAPYSLVPDQPFSVDEDNLWTEDINTILARFGDVDLGCDPDEELELVSYAVNDSLIAADGTNYNWMPAENWFGNVIISATVEDHYEASATESWTLTVNPVNDTPWGEDWAETIEEDGEISINVQQYFDDIENGHNLYISDVTFDANFDSYFGPYFDQVVPELYVGEDFDVSFSEGNLVISPPKDWNSDVFGDAVFHITVTDILTRATVTSDMTLTVTSVNDGPVEISTLAGHIMDEEQVFCVPVEELTAVFWDPEVGYEDDELYFFSGSINSPGNVEADGLGNICTTPAVDYFGCSTITYYVRDLAQLVAQTAHPLTILNVNDALTVESDISPSTNEDTPLQISNSAILGMYADVDFGEVCETVADDYTERHEISSINAANGTINEVNGNWLYTPNLNYYGTDSVTVVVNDNADAMGAEGSFSLQHGFHITVNPVNDLVSGNYEPAINFDEDNTFILGDIFDRSEGEYLFTDVETPDSLLSFSSIDWQPAAAMSSVEYDSDSNALYFEPAENWYGEFSLTLGVTDMEIDGVGPDISTFYYNGFVNSVNDQILLCAGMPTQDTIEDQSFVFPDVTSYFCDPADNDVPVYQSAVANVAQFVLEYDEATDALTVGPPSNFNNIVNITITVSDMGSPATFAQGTLSIDFGGVNDCPYQNQYVDDFAPITVDEDQVFVVESVIEHFVDPEDNPVTIRSVSSENFEQFWDFDFEPADSSLTIVPPANLNSTFGTWVYMWAWDGYQECESVRDSVLVYIDPVNDAPVYLDQAVEYLAVIDGVGGSYTADPNPFGTYMGSEDDSLFFEAEELLSHFFDVDTYWWEEDTLTVESLEVDGTLLTEEQGRFVYVPDENFNGMLLGHIVVEDQDGLSAEADFDVELACVNDEPFVDGEYPDYTVDEDGSLVLTSTQLLAVWDDADLAYDCGDALSVYSLTATHVNENADPAWEDASVVSSRNSFTVYPGADRTDPILLTIEVTDAYGAVEATQLTITVVNFNNDEVSFTGNFDVISIPEDSLFTLETDFLLAEFSDIDLLQPMGGDTLSVHEISFPGGSISQMGETYTFTPDPNTNGSFMVSMTIWDGEYTADADIMVEVLPVNDCVVLGEAMDNVGGLSEDNNFTVHNAAYGHFADIDLDNEGDTFDVTSVEFELVENGSQVLFDQESWGWSYDEPSDNLVIMPQPNFHGRVNVSVYVNDSFAECADVFHTFEATLVNINDCPVVIENMDPQSMVEDENFVIDGPFADYFYDVDGDFLDYSATVSNGDVIVYGNDSLVVIPDENFCGTTILVLNANDASCTGSMAIELLVECVNDAPFLANPLPTQSINEDAPFVLTKAFVLAYFDDPDLGSDDELVITSAIMSCGEVEESLTEFTFTPNDDYNTECGVCNIEFMVSDEGGLTTTANMAVAIAAVNDGPTFCGTATSPAYNEGVSEILVVDIFSYFCDVDMDCEGDEFHFGGQYGVDFWIENVVDGDWNSGGAFNTDCLNWDVDADNVSFSLNDECIDWNGTFDIHCRVSDNFGQYASGVLRHVTINPVNDCPEVSPAGISDAEIAFGECYTLTNVSSYMVDVEGDDCVIAAASMTPGTATIGDNEISFCAPEGYSGYATACVTLSDGFSGCEFETCFSIQVTVNNAPELEEPFAAIAINEDQCATLANVLDHFMDPDMDEILLTEFYILEEGLAAIELIGDDNLSLCPTANSFEDFTVVLRIEDEFGAFVVHQIPVTVNPVNDAPTAENLELAITEGECVEIDWPIADIDNSLEDLTLVITNGPSAAQGVLDGNSFCATDTYNGTVVITYFVNDGSLASSLAQVIIEVNGENDAPVCEDLAFTIDEDAELLEFNLSDSAYDQDGDELVFSLVSGVSEGTLTLTEDGACSYLADANYHGVVSFMYEANDGIADSNPATVTITINSINDLPVAEDLQLSMSEGDCVGISWPVSDADNSMEELEIVIVSGPTADQGVLSGNQFCGTDNFAGNVEIVFYAMDAEASSEEATVTITVIGVNDAPVCEDGSFELMEDFGSYTFDLTEYASDVDGDELIFSLVDGPTEGSLDLDTSGACTFSADENWYGDVSFTFMANDGTDDSANNGTITISVEAVNDAPVVANPFEEDLVMDEDSEGSDVDLSNVFFDVDGDPLSYTAEYDEEALSVSIIGATATIIPVADYYGVTSISFTADDGQSAVASTFASSFTISSRLSGKATRSTRDFSMSSGAAQIITPLMDEGRDTASTTLGVIVNAMDDEPVLVTPFEDITLEEDEVTTWCISAEEIISHFADADNSLEAVTVCENIPADYCGQMEIEVCVTGGTVELCESFMLTVTCVNDAPSVALNTTDATSCGWVEELGHYEGSVEGFVPAWMNGEITLDLTDVDNSSLTVSYFIDDVEMESISLATGMGVELPYFEGLADYFGDNVTLHVEVTDGEAPVWNAGGGTCTWILGFLDVAEMALPEEFYLDQNFPNPFNPSTTVRFGLPTPQELSIAVYNIHGQRISTLLSGNQPAGHHELVWNAGASASGVYFLVVEGTDIFEVKKMTLLR